MLSHSTEELAYVLTGTGELRLEDEVVPYVRGVGAVSSRRASGTRS